MTGDHASSNQELRDVEALLRRLREAEQALQAIRCGEIDSLVIRTPAGNQIFHLRDPNILYRVFFEEMPHGAATLSQGGTILYGNRSLNKLLGVPFERLVGAAWSTFVAAEDQGKLVDLFRQAQAGGFSCDCTLVAGDGTHIPAALAASGFHADEVPLTCLVITDLTSRRKAEQALSASENRYRGLVDSLPQLVWTADPAGQIVEDSLSWRRFTGQSFDELRGSGWLEAVHPDDRAHTQASWQRALATRAMYDTEYRLRRKDGTYRDIMARAVPILENGSTLREWVGTCTDITIRKQAEQELQRVNRALRALSHCSEAQVRATDEPELLDRVCRLVVEEAGYRMCWVGFPLQDEARNVRPVAWAGTDAEYLAQVDIHWSDTERGRGPSGTALRTGRLSVCNDVATDPRMLPWRDEALRRGFRSCVALPLREGDRVLGMLAIYAGEPDAFRPDELTLLTELADDLVYGLTTLRLRGERDRAQERIRRLNAELEQRVRERTAELEASIQELESFAYSISHDLRAPLRAIDGFAQILLTDYLQLLPEKPQHYLQVVCENTRRMGRLIDDLLRFSRTSRQALDVQELAPGGLVRQCLEDLQPECADRQVEVQIQELPACWADVGLLRQVWLNLLANALKFTRQRDPARIEVGGQVRDGETVYYVKDNGVGFDMQYADKLFGVFQRLHSVAEYEGTGIGLALVQRIIHRHGGRIWAEAAPDQGATFYFTLGKRRC